jgi:hypothetical protein
MDVGLTDDWILYGYVVLSFRVWGFGVLGFDVYCSSHCRPILVHFLSSFRHEMRSIDGEICLKTQVQTQWASSGVNG